MAEIPVSIPKMPDLKDVLAAKTLGSPDAVVRFATADARPDLKQVDKLASSTPETLDRNLKEYAAPQDHSREAAKVMRRIDTARNPTTFARDKVNDPELLQLGIDGKFQAELTNEYLTRGYDGLTDSPDPLHPGTTITKERKQQILRNRVLTPLRKRPNYQAVIASDGEVVVAERILHDPRYRAELDQNFSQRLDSAQTEFNQYDPDVARMKLIHTEIDAKTAAQVLADKTKQQEIVNDRLKSFLDRDGADRKTIEELSVHQRDYERIIGSTEKQLTQLYDRQSALLQEQHKLGILSKLDPRKQTELNQINTTLKTYEDAQTNLYKLQDLKAEQTELLASQTNLTTEIAEAQKNVFTTKEAHAEAKEDGVYVEHKHRQAARACVASLTNLESDTTKAYTDAIYAEWDTAYKSVWPDAQAAIAQVAGQKEADLNGFVHDALFNETETYDREIGSNGLWGRKKSYPSYRTRWETETEASVLRRAQYREKGLIEPIPDMVPDAELVEKEFNIFMHDPDQILISMSLDGKNFAEYTDPVDKNILRRGLAREIINIRQELTGKPLADNERRFLLNNSKNKGWVDQMIVDSVPKLPEVQAELAHNGVTAENVSALTDPQHPNHSKVLNRVRTIFAGKGGGIFLSLLMYGGMGGMTLLASSDRH